MRRRDYIRIALTDPFCVILLSLFGLVLAAVTLFFVGLRNAAWITGNVGTLAVLFGGLFYAAWRDPEKRYPHDSFRTRLSKIVTFKQ